LHHIESIRFRLSFKGRIALPFQMPCFTVQLSATPSVSLFTPDTSPIPNIMASPAKTELSIMVLGSAHTGKTTLLTSHLFNVFSGFYAPTFDQVFLGPTPKTHPGIKKVTFLDVGASSDITDRLLPPYLTISDAIVLVFSLVSRSSLEDITKRWLPLAKQYRKPILLVGTMKELRRAAVPIGDTREVTEMEGMRVAGRIGAVWYGECSALTEEGLADVFENAVKASLGEPVEVIRKTPEAMAFARYFGSGL
jgi:GTPase SAR1 family protein